MSLLQGIRGALKVRGYLHGVDRLKQSCYARGLIAAYKLSR